jgi:hypothetical protein
MGRIDLVAEFLGSLLKSIATEPGRQAGDIAPFLMGAPLTTAESSAVLIAHALLLLGRDRLVAALVIVADLGIGVDAEVRKRVAGSKISMP